MRVSSVISNITQIVNRSHSNLQDLTADDHNQYQLVDGSRSLRGVKIGLDASKSASPSQGEAFWATDTKKLYYCYSAGTWTQVDFIITSNGASQGDILYFDGGKWEKLPAGTTGQFLKTQGAGANPTWETVPVVYIKVVESDVIIAEALTQRSSSSGTYTKVKEIQIKMGGRIRVTYDYTIQDYTGYGQIYLNGSPVAGTEDSWTGGGSASHDIDVSQDDLVQLYIKNSNNKLTYVSNFRLRGNVVPQAVVNQN